MGQIINFFLILIATFLISCGENTTQTIIPDVASIEIVGGNQEIRATDDTKDLKAIITYTDGSTADGTPGVDWNNSNYGALSMLGGKIEGGRDNGGTSTLFIQHGRFSDSIEVTVHKLTSFYISSPQIDTKGEHTLQAKGNFDNNDSNITIIKNIFWSADNDALITLENDIFTIDIKSGDTNVTATMFGDINESSPIAPKSRIYTIN